MSKKTARLSQRMYLLRLLVKRNIKNQYYRSFIGVLWTVLYPLFTCPQGWEKGVFLFF